EVRAIPVEERHISFEKENGDLVKVFRLPVETHFSAERIPEGYYYKGGAARALLLRPLGVDTAAFPRDIDIVRVAEGYSDHDDDRDDEVSKYFMAEDYEHGDGVEVTSSYQWYFESRDFTL